ncbi:MAG: tetratricopeptide repeat protein [Candidatus Latescibacteria bacterium]|nr:tetratricopeptide repeat protein [Candidatus Latescibacterota bacterium]
MVKKMTVIWAIAALLMSMQVRTWAEEGEAATSAVPADSAAASQEEGDWADDEEWLNTVWNQVDNMVDQESLKLQKTVTVAGVRGAEAEDVILKKLYFKGGKRFPSQEKLRNAVAALQQSIEKDPKAKDVPQKLFFIGQCYEKLANKEETAKYYDKLIKEYPGTPFAAKAQVLTDNSKR